jgi:thiamine phosphate synthase YjbQ (UPF0047 family)
MPTHAETLTISTRRKGLHEITREVAAVVARSAVRTGIANVFVRHTSASLVIMV